jgi:large subunit ribosomal protein L34
LVVGGPQAARGSFGQVWSGVRGFSKFAGQLGHLDPAFKRHPFGKASVHSCIEAAVQAIRKVIMKRTYQASKVRRARTHGFLVRMKTRGGRAVINARRAKGRKRLAV